MMTLPLLVKFFVALVVMLTILFVAGCKSTYNIQRDETIDNSLFYGNDYNETYQ